MNEIYQNDAKIRFVRCNGMFFVVAIFEINVDLINSMENL